MSLHMALQPSEIGSSHHRASEPVPVLLIASAGRSGSTLLDRVIGAQEGFCSVGELRFIWERSFGENQLCGCGLPFHECAFWRAVSCEVFGVEAAQVDAATAIRLRKSLDEMRNAPWLIQPYRPARFRSALGVYSQLLESLYEGILKVSGARVIVDSSGDATHGHILSQLPNVETHVVHLVRDSRAVAFSSKRTRERPEIHWKSENMPIEHVHASSKRWMEQNAVAELLSKSAASYSRLRYEDFVTDPYAALSGILAPYGWRQSQPQWTQDTEIVLEPAHTVSGNPMRFKQGQLKIKLDDEWRRVMPQRDRRLATAITWPLLARYGYLTRRGV
jgi:Sulfotransferase family